MSKSKRGQSLINEFHIALDIRVKYRMDEFLFGNDGRLILTNFRMVRELVYRLNKTRDPRQQLFAGEVNAAGLLDEIYHLLMRYYEEKVNPGVFSRLKDSLMDDPDSSEYRALLLDFIRKFPPLAVYRGQVNAHAYLMGHTDNRSNMEIAIEELIMLHLANVNPANKKLIEFFDERYLDTSLYFKKFIELVENFFMNEPPIGESNLDIFSMLKTPMKVSPDDLNAQLDYILINWKKFLPESATLKILQGQDLMREDVLLEGGPGGPGNSLPPRYKEEGDEGADFSIGKSHFKYGLEIVKDYEEYEHFTDDIHWMPKVVMIAKNTYVWLDQLSKKYQREIRRLDQVPDEELDQLVGWNINALWLIGVWERSSASKRIKHIMGNIDAVSSAYSLYDYEIAADLGGEQAFRNFDQRARQRGIRLAGDMVPNHTGIFSRWVIEHPDYFIQSPFPPFPGYSFSGENLSPDPSVQIKLEDGYYNKTDASVVFQRIDNNTNEVRYIYHGNDGTLMPWNDTAQLDFLKKEVREAVIQKIFDVARKFSIIRFDAAMTLAKKHFARLWYPRPGTGGDIASRADYAMTQAAFDEMFPVEFWREVVDRINNEMPDTLLLAEAFWFMEGYFVRTLGMHRVYNSAFMHMLNNEENYKYRELIYNTLEFEPEILKRYVNFMSNPDEETAIKQFGTGDKYFGICMLMTTLPGLPMFGHGQIEGYTEKYGMEYQRAYYNEVPDKWLVEKHEREIFPLMAKRYLFSEVVNFNLYDFIDQNSHLNENVIAFSNSYGPEKVLVMYNNKYDSTSGRIFHSVPKLDKQTGDVHTVTLPQALGIKNQNNIYYILREHFSGQEYLLSAEEAFNSGFKRSLRGFEYKVFFDFSEVTDHTGELKRLYDELDGKGTDNINNALTKIRLQPVHDAFVSLFQEDYIRILSGRIVHGEITNVFEKEYSILEQRFADLFAEMAKHDKKWISSQAASDNLKQHLKAAERVSGFILSNGPSLKEKMAIHQLPLIEEMLVFDRNSNYHENLHVLLGFFIASSLKRLAAKFKDDPVENYKLFWPLHRAFAKTGRGPHGVARDASMVMILLTEEASKVFDFCQILKDEPDDSKVKEGKKNIDKLRRQSFIQLLDSDLVKDYIGLNEYEDKWYFSKENFDELLQWLFSGSLFQYFLTDYVNQQEPEMSDFQEKLIAMMEFVKYLRLTGQKAGYIYEELKRLLSS